MYSSVNVCFVICVSFYILLVPSCGELVGTVWYYKNTSGRIPNGIMGRDVYRIPEWLKARLDFTGLLSLFTFSPHLVPSIQSWCASLTLSLPLSRIHLSPPSSIHLPSFFSFLPMCCWNKSVCMCVTESVTYDHASTAPLWSRRISAYKSTFHLH